ncbi:glucose-6-phosphate dehydrogenase [Glycomyces tarimensis]
MAYTSTGSENTLGPLGMATPSQPDAVIETLVILGASGDLAGRYLYPAAARLHEEGLLGRTTIIGIDRREQSGEAYRSMVRERVARHAPQIPESVIRDFAGRLRYRTADVSDADQLDAVMSEAAGPMVVYLALPNRVFLDTVRALADRPPPAGSRLVVEKPFGTDLADARRLNEAVHECFAEEDVYRIDHFLAKQTVLNVLGLRFANRIFDPVWNELHVRAVDIVWDETLALEGRAGYYDNAGALKDMIQNHLLQLLALTAMEPPTSMNQRDLRNAKSELLRAVRVPEPEQMSAATKRARYTAGTIGDRAVPSYIDEDGVDPERQTETFAEVTLAIDNRRWAGVPFRLRSGKALGAGRREIALHFRPTPHQPFPESAPANVLRFALNPDTIAIGVNLNGAGDPFDLERAELDAEFPNQQLPAYAKLLLGILHGDQTLSIRADEAEECWRIVEPILSAWENGTVPMDAYTAGTSGP